jgi:hypothetical protein
LDMLHATVGNRTHGVVRNMQLPKLHYLGNSSSRNAQNFNV